MATKNPNLDIPRDHDRTDEVVGRHLNLVIGEQLQRIEE
jgi:hypothetical protein